MRKIIFAAITIVIFAFIIYFLIGYRDMLIEHISRRPFLVLWIAILFSIGRILDALKFKIAALPLDVKVNLTELMALAFSVPFYNTIMPYGGALTQYAYFKKERNYPIVHLVLVQSMKIITGILVNCLLGAGVLWFVFFRKGDFFGIYFFIIYVVLFFIPVAVLAMPDIRVRSKGRFHDILNRLFESWAVLRQHKIIFIAVLLIHVMHILVFTFRYYLVFILLSIKAPYIGLLAVIPACNLLNAVNILPGNIGVREFVLSLSVKILGFDFVSGALSSMVDRVILTVVILIAGGWFHIKLGYNVAKREKR